MTKKKKQKKPTVCGDCGSWNGRGDGFGTCEKEVLVGNLSRKTTACKKSEAKCNE